MTIKKREKYGIEDRTFHLGEKVLNDPDCTSMYRGRIGYVTRLHEYDSGRMDVSVKYSATEKETHPSWVLYKLDEKHLPDELFEL